MKLTTTDSRGNIIKHTLAQLSDLYKYAACYENWEKLSEASLDYLETKGAEKHFKSRIIKQADRAEDSLLKEYNKQFGTNLRPSYDFHLIDEMAAKSLYLGVIED
jgi:hypothetical protein